MIIINAKIYTMDDEGIIENGYIQIENGKISEIGKISNIGSMQNLDKDNLPSDCYDAKGAFVLPGFIDAHTHLGIIGDSLGFESDDLNEMTDPSTPHMRGIDAINPMDLCFEEAYKAGITSVVTGPGSANPVSGQMLAIKTFGKRIDNMLLSEPCAIKFALGENPKGVYHMKNLSPETRMATAAIIRETLKKAKKYMKDIERAETDEDFEKPDFDFKCDALIPLLKKKIPAHFHAHRADDIFTAVRIAQEFDLDFSLVHCTEGHMIAKELSEIRCENKPLNVFCGPNFSDRSKPELKNKSEKSPKILSENGLSVSIVTDHPEIPIQYLPLCAVLAVKNGMDRYEALKAITINPARALNLNHKIGSLAKGKDADIVVFDGDPLDFYTKVKLVMIDGKTVFDAKTDDK